MRYVGIRSAQSVAICVKGYIFLLREKEIDTRPRFYQERTEDSERKESKKIQRYCRGQVGYYYLDSIKKGRMEDSETKESNEIQRYCRGQVAYYYLVPRFYQERTDGRFGKERIKRNPKIILLWPR